MLNRHKQTWRRLYRSGWQSFGRGGGLTTVTVTVHARVLKFLGPCVMQQCDVDTDKLSGSMFQFVCIKTTASATAHRENSVTATGHRKNVTGGKLSHSHAHRANSVIAFATTHSENWSLKTRWPRVKTVPSPYIIMWTIWCCPRYEQLRYSWSPGVDTKVRFQLVEKQSIGLDVVIIDWFLQQNIVCHCGY